jgi:MFS family permease
MSSPGVDVIEDAYEDTKDILLPFDLKTWTMFAVIVLLAGNISLPTNFFTGPTGDFGNDFEGDFGMDNQVPETGLQLQDGFSGLDSLVGQNYLSSSVTPAALGLIVIAVVGVFLIFGLIGSIFQFVLYRSVNDKEPKLGHAKSYLRAGAKYFGYRILAIGLILGYIAITILAASVSLWTLALTVPIGLISLLVFLIVDWIVFHITLPEMIYEETGFIESFKASVYTVQENLGDVILFWLMKFIISSAIGIGVFILMVIVGLAIGIPLVLLGLALQSINTLLVIPVALIGVIAALVLIVYTAVPVQVFLRSYILHFYEEIRN